MTSKDFVLVGENMDDVLTQVVKLNEALGRVDDAVMELRRLGLPSAAGEELITHYAQFVKTWLAFSRVWWKR